MAKENRLDEYAEQLDVFIEKRKLDLNNSTLIEVQFIEIKN